MTKKKADPKEVNELYEIWDENNYGVIRREYQKGKGIKELWVDYKWEREDRSNEIFRFWTLKEKIDKLQMKADELEDIPEELECPHCGYSIKTRP